MELKNKKLFIPIFILLTSVFSYLAYSPKEIAIAGPYFPQIDYFEEELDLISKDLNVKIRYCLLYTSPSPRDKRQSRMPSSA